MTDAARNAFGESRIKHRGGEDGVSGREAGTNDKGGRDVCSEDQVHEEGRYEPGEGHYRT